MFRRQLLQPFLPAVLCRLFFRQHQAIGGMGAPGQCLFAACCQFFQSRTRGSFPASRTAIHSSLVDLLVDLRHQAFVYHRRYTVKQV